MNLEILLGLVQAEWSELPVRGLEIRPQGFVDEDEEPVESLEPILWAWFVILHEVDGKPEECLAMTG